MASIICGNCKKTVDNVEHVRACYYKSNDPWAPKPSPAPVVFVPTDEQADLRQREEAWQQRLAEHNAAKRADASAPIRSVREQTPVGVYSVDGVIYKVKPARTSSRTFAHELTLTVGGEPIWTYRGLASRFIPAGHPMVTKEEAAEFGHTHGYCMMCGRLLTNEESIAAGIGPVCAGKMGW